VYTSSEEQERGEEEGEIRKRESKAERGKEVANLMYATVLCAQQFRSPFWPSMRSYKALRYNPKINAYVARLRKEWYDNPVKH